MGILVAHIDGLIVGSSADVPNTDPLTHGVEIYNRLTEAKTEATLLTAAFGNPARISGWLRQWNVTSTWLESMDGLSAEKRIEATLSFVGKHHTTISMFIGVDPYDCATMAGHGIATLQYRAPQRIIDWGPEPGASWYQRKEEIESE